MSDRYHPSPDQVALARALCEPLASILPLARLPQLREESAEAWTRLRALGVFGIAIPEAHGGSGLGAAEEALIAFELGRCCAAPSVLATIAATHLARTQSEGRVAAGFRCRDRVVFFEDSAADSLLVRNNSGAALYTLPALSTPIDPSLWGIRLRETALRSEPLAATSSDTALRLRLLDAAVLAGIASAALDMAVHHANVREQFGRPIGSFQAVKHHCANMALATRCATDQVRFAAVALDDGRDEAQLQVESALFVAGSAAIRTCSKNIQVHGAIGFSDEAVPHHLLKRARLYVELAGGLEAALTRVGDCPVNSELVERE